MEERRRRLLWIRGLWKLFEPKKNEVTGGWRQLRKEDLRDLHSSRSIIRVIKSKRMKWAGNETGLGKKRKEEKRWRNPYTLFVGKPEGK
jgi:hypothetical protein